MDKATEQPIAYQHEGGEMHEAATIEAAHATCPVLGKMSLEQAGLLLELQAMGKEIQAEQRVYTKAVEPTEAKSELRKITKKEPVETVMTTEENKLIQTVQYSAKVVTETVQEPTAKVNTIVEAAAPSDSGVEPTKPSTKVQPEQVAKPSEDASVLIDQLVHAEILNDSPQIAPALQTEVSHIVDVESVTQVTTEPTVDMPQNLGVAEPYSEQNVSAQTFPEVEEPSAIALELTVDAYMRAEADGVEATNTEPLTLNNLEVIPKIASTDITELVTTPANDAETESFELPEAHTENNLETILLSLEPKDTESVLNLTEAISELPKETEPQVAEVVIAIEEVLQSLSENFDAPVQTEMVIEIPVHKVIVELVQELVELAQMEYQQEEIEKLVQLILENPDTLQILTGQIALPRNYALSKLGTYEGLAQQSSSPLYATNLPSNHSLLGRYALLPFASLQAA